MAETSRESAVIDHADAVKRIIMNLPEIMILSRRLETTSKEYVKTTEELFSSRSSVLPMEEYFLRARSKLPEILKMLLDVLGEISNEPLKSLQEPVQSSDEPVQSLKELLDYLVCFMEQETSLYKELLEYIIWLQPLEHMMEYWLEMMEQESEDRDTLEFDDMRWISYHLDEKFRRLQDNFDKVLKQYKRMEQESEDRDTRKLDEILEKLRILLLKFETSQCIFDKMMLIQAKLRQASYGELVRIIDDIKSALLEFPFKPLTKSGDADNTEQVKKGLRQKLDEIDEKLRIHEQKLETSNYLIYRIRHTQAELEASLRRQERIIDGLKSAVREPRFKLLTKLGDADTTEQVMKGLGQKVDELDEKFRILQQKFEARRKDITAELEASLWEQERITDDLISALRESRFKLLAESGDADSTKQVMKGLRQKVDEVHEKLRILQPRVQESQDIAEARLKDIPVKGLRQKFEDPDNQIKVDEINEKLRIVQQRVQTIHDSLEKIVIKEIAKARSSALKFMSANPSCVRAVPYVNDCERMPVKYLTMRLYIHTGGNEIPQDVKKAAEEMFTDYEIHYCDLQRRPLNRIVTQLPSSEKKRKKELSELSKIIEENLYVFENRLNVTAVQASYKVTDAKEKDELCVTVFVLGKGQIPAGETKFEEIEKLHDDYPYDIAEGYYQSACLPVLGSYASPLHSGVGIGVKDDPDRGAGTLGGFLTDEEGKFYVLSCQHVLCPAKMKNSAGHAIFQPAESDYRKIVDEAKGDLNRSKRELERTKQTMMDMDISLDDMDEDYKNYLERKQMGHKLKEDNLKKDEKKLDTVDHYKPRQIGTYAGGVKGNIRVDLELGKVFVDAAIAALDNSERRLIEEEDPEDNRLYGCPKQYFKERPNYGEIVDMKQFDKELDENEEELTFIKVGRTTGLRQLGKFDRDIKAFINDIFQRKYCKNCEHPDGSVVKIYKEDGSHCANANCNKKLENDEEIASFWLHNCRAIRQDHEPFCEEGDSGALVFDANGRAWGQVVGVFRSQFLYCIMSPLSATLAALREKVGKDLQLWCRKKC